MTKHLLGTGLAAITIAAGLAVTEARAGSVNVFVGYADSLRPSGFFPGPWIGDSGVVSNSPGVQAGGFDSGALRFDNTTGSAITVSDLTVTLNGGGGPSFAIWTPLTIGAGQDGIFTQTVAYNFDSSDSGGSDLGIIGSSPGSNGIGGCSSTAAALGAANVAFCATVQPIVTFSLDGGSTFLTLNDTGHILDTGHYDFINGSTDGNESINWNSIGSEAIRGGTAPEPSTWAMMLLGFAGLGFAGYRKAKSVAAVA
jgi:hypothetical protein